MIDFLNEVSGPETEWTHRGLVHAALPSRWTMFAAWKTLAPRRSCSHRCLKSSWRWNRRALDDDLSRGTESFAESLAYLPELADYRMTQEVYLEHSAARQSGGEYSDTGQPERRHGGRLGTVRERNGRGGSGSH